MTARENGRVGKLWAVRLCCSDGFSRSRVQRFVQPASSVVWCRCRVWSELRWLRSTEYLGRRWKLRRLGLSHRKPRSVNTFRAVASFLGSAMAHHQATHVRKYHLHQSLLINHYRRAYTP